MVAHPKQKLRRTKKTILFVGEGPTEKAFLQHIKQLYITRDMDLAVKVECGSGGSPQNVVEKTIRLRSSSSYDRCFVLIDSDLPFQPHGELKRRICKKPHIEILCAIPCVEGLFLAILKHPRFSRQSATSSMCKRIFEETYIPHDRKTDKRFYKKLFPKEILDAGRRDIPEFNAILEAMDI